MNLSKILFPAPTPSYDEATLDGEMIWIPYDSSVPGSKSATISRPKSLERGSLGSKPSKRLFPGDTQRRAFAKHAVSHENSPLPSELLAKADAYIKLTENQEASASNRTTLEESQFPRESSPDVAASYLALQQHSHNTSNQGLTSKSRRTSLFKPTSAGTSGVVLSKISNPKPHRTKAGGCFGFIGGKAKKKAERSKEQEIDNHINQIMENMYKRHGRPKPTSLQDLTIKYSKFESPTIPEEVKTIPRTYTSELKNNHIPTLLLKSKRPTRRVLIYFHANNEDLFQSYDLLEHLRRTLKVCWFKS